MTNKKDKSNNNGDNSDGNRKGKGTYNCDCVAGIISIEEDI